MIPIGHFKQQKRNMDVDSYGERRPDMSSTFMRNKEIKVALTGCGGEGGWPRAAGVDGRQGWHGGTGEATGG